MLKNCIAALLLIAASSVLAQDVKTTPQPKPTIRELTLENVFDPKAKVSFAGSPQGGFTWLDDKTFAWPRTEEGKVVEQAVIETETGKKRVLFNADKLEAAAKKIAGVSSDDAAGFAKQRTGTSARTRRASCSPSATTSISTPSTATP